MSPIRDTLGWAFLSTSNTKINLGETLYLVGLPAQEGILDALYDATGTMAHCVWLWDKNQTLLWRVDAKDVIPVFARRCAADVVHLWDAPPCVHKFLSTGKGASAARAAATTTLNATAIYTAAIRATRAARAAAYAADLTYNAAYAADAANAAAHATHAAAHAGTYAAAHAPFAAAYAAAHAAARKKYVDMLISMLVEAGIT